MRNKRNMKLNNSEDRHIGRNGTETRIFAKNIMEGDAFLLSGDRIGKVVSNRVTVRPRRRYTAKITVKTPSGKTFERVVDGDTRIAIREYPETRFERRRMSRKGDSRPNYRRVSR